jgi:hypothetical protein
MPPPPRGGGSLLEFWEDPVMHYTYYITAGNLITAKKGGDGQLPGNYPVTSD